MKRQKTTLAETDLYFATVEELNEHLRQKQVSAQELAEVFSTRLEHYGPQYNALALSLKKQALKAAKDVDDDFKWERHRSRLQGVPYAVKDLLAWRSTRRHGERSRLRIRCSTKMQWWWRG